MTMLRRLVSVGIGAAISTVAAASGQAHPTEGEDAMLLVVFVVMAVDGCICHVALLSLAKSEKSAESHCTLRLIRF